MVLRHGLSGADARAVARLSVTVIVATLLGRLEVASRLPHILRAHLFRAGRRAVPEPIVALSTEREHRVTQPTETQHMPVHPPSGACSKLDKATSRVRPKPSGPTPLSSSHAAWRASSAPHPFLSRRATTRLRGGSERGQERDDGSRSRQAALGAIVIPRFSTIASTLKDPLTCEGVAEVVKANVVDGPAAAGVHAVAWDVGDHAAGVYFLRLRSEGRSASRRVVVVR